MPMGNRSRAEF